MLSSFLILFVAYSILASSSCASYSILYKIKFLAKVDMENPFISAYCFIILDYSSVTRKEIVGIMLTPTTTLFMLSP